MITTKAPTEKISMYRSIATILLATSLVVFANQWAPASERRIAGTITKVDCGEGPIFDILRKGENHLSGTCYEEWCHQLCGDRTGKALKKMIGRKISASFRVINVEEPEFGLLTNEFYDVILE